MGMVVSYFGANGPINPVPVSPFSNVSLLVGFEGPSDGTDDSSYSHSPTFSSTGWGFGRDNTVSKFGSFSMKSIAGQDGNSALTYADHSSFNFGSGAFCLECWVRFNSYATNNRQYFVDQFDLPGNERSWALLINNGALQLMLSSDGTSETVKASSSWSPSTGVWYHIAGDFDGTTYRTYVNGALKASSTGVVTLHNSTSPVRIIRRREFSTDYGNLDGYVDEVRVTKGQTPYASATGFSPPTAAFPRS